MAEMSQY
ncbi:hypothetical protein ECEC1863_2450, partial [Escherichia coli EC1863]